MQITRLWRGLISSAFSKNRWNCCMSSPAFGAARSVKQRGGAVHGSSFFGKCKFGSRKQESLFKTTNYRLFFSLARIHFLIPKTVYSGTSIQDASPPPFATNNCYTVFKNPTFLLCFYHSAS